MTFHLAGINNQNFLMRDDQTGSYWQQISGLCVSGPLRGRRLTLIHSDELSYGLWSAEEPHGTVLKSVSKYSKDYEKKDWEKRILKYKTVLSFANPARKLEPRSVMLGVRAFGASRAFLYDEVVKEKLVLDYVGHEPVLLVVGPDGESVRVFRRRIAGVDQIPDFYRTFTDASTNSPASSPPTTIPANAADAAALKPSADAAKKPTDRAAANKPSDAAVLKPAAASAAMHPSADSVATKKPFDATALKQAVDAPIMIDQSTQSEWNFRGCAVSGKFQGTCLEPIDMLKDYWFDWRNYNPDTSVYAHP